MNQEHEYSTFGRQVGYVIAGNIATLLLGFLQIPILTKGLGASLYGTWSLIHVTILLIAPFAQISFGASIVRFLSAERDIHKTRDDFFSACSLVFVSGIIFSLILFFLSDYLAVSIFKDAAASSYIKLGAALILINPLFTVLLAFFRMRRKIGLYTVLHISREVLHVGLAATALLLGYMLGGVITAFIISGILIIVISLSIILRQTGFQFPKFSNMKSYLKWGIPLTPNTAMLWIMNVSDRYMISYFLGTASAGIYNAAYSIGQYAAFALTPVSTVLYPAITKTYDIGDHTKTASYINYSLKYLMMIAIPAAFGLSILAKPLIQILTTSEFVTGSSVVPWVASGIVINCFFRLGVYILYLAGKTHFTLWFLGISATLNIILNIILIPRIGIVGAAVSTLLAYFVLGLLTVIITRRYLKIDLNLLFIAKSVFASCVMALCIWLLNPESLTLVIISIIGGIIIYFAVLILTRGLNRQEIKFFTNFIRENFKKVFMLK